MWHLDKNMTKITYGFSIKYFKTFDIHFVSRLHIFVLDISILLILSQYLPVCRDDTLYKIVENTKRIIKSHKSKTYNRQLYVQRNKQ